MSLECNKKNCICPKKDCEKHGKCCTCINHHKSVETPVYCMRKLLKSTAKK